MQPKPNTDLDITTKLRYNLDHLIANLGKGLLAKDESFEELARQEAGKISVDDLTYLREKLHHPPQLHPDITEKELRLGEWQAVCQYVIFELIYLLDVKALTLLETIAFGEYDWTQATALVVICRLYLDDKVPAEMISKIDSRLGTMRHETHLYFAQDLINRRERDPRFNQLFVLIKNTDFRLALAELGHNQPMTREELIGLGKGIIAADGSEEEIQKLMELFDKNVAHPKGSNLFYYPEDYNSRIHDISQYNPTVEEVVDKCLSYKPIIL
jgi:Colicin immunity protein / pyocin immunity protein